MGGGCFYTHTEKHVDNTRQYKVRGKYAVNEFKRKKKRTKEE